jgi:uncharacterized membrane protein
MPDSMEQTKMKCKNMVRIIIVFIVISVFVAYPGSGMDSLSFFDEQQPSSRAQINSTFIASNILNQPGGSLAGGIDIGDPDNDGTDEVIVVGGSGERGAVTVIDYNETRTGWDTPTIWIDSQALVDVVISDLDPNEDGAEVVVGGYSRNITILFWHGGLSTPRVHTIDTLPQQIFGMAAGDLNTSHSGMELAVVDGKTPDLVIYQSSDSPDAWEKHTIQFNESLRNVHIGEFDPLHEGDELIVLSSNGSIYSVMHNPDNSWDIEWIWQDSDNLLDAAIGDADLRYEGNEIIVVGLSRNATMLRKTAADEWVTTSLWTAPGGLEGIDIGNFDPSTEQNEIAIGGYSRTVVMLSLENDNWLSKEVYRDPESSQSELNGVVIGEFHSAHQGNEVMVVGASGVTTLLEFEHPEFTISTPTYSKSIKAAESVVFTIVIGTVSSFQGTVDLAVDSSLDYSLAPTSVDAPGTSTLTVNSNESTPLGTYLINMTASSGSELKQITLSVTVTSSDKPDFNLEVTPTALEIERLPKGSSDDSNIYDASTGSVKITIESISGFNNNVELNLTGLTSNFEGTFNIDEILPGESAELNIKLKSNPPDDQDTFQFTLKAQSGELLHFENLEIKLVPSQADLIDNSSSSSNGNISIALLSMIIIIIILINIIILFMYVKYRYKSNQQMEKESENDSDKTKRGRK